MAKQITLNYEGVDYTLEFTRKTAAELETRGFLIEELFKKPNVRMPELFAGAFLAKCRYVQPDKIRAIYSKIADKEKFIGKLAEMYYETIQTLFDEPEESEGNATWTATW